MADLPSIAKKIQVEEADERLPTSESMVQKVGGSLNWLMDNGSGLAIGSMEFSFLTLAQFQAINGTGFVLCDGSALPGGSLYGAITGRVNTPDMRGFYPRMRDHGAGVNPAGDLAVSTVQSAAIKGHSHPTSISNPTGPGLVNAMGQALIGVNNANNGGDEAPVDPVNFATFTPTVSPQGTGSGDAQHIRGNWFLRVN